MVVRSNIVGIDSPQALEKALRAAYYLADEGLSTAAYLALALNRSTSLATLDRKLAGAARKEGVAVLGPFGLVD